MPPSTSLNAVSPGFFWDGNLAEVKVNALYAACHSLRFTGRLNLKDDNHQAQIIFLGGDPVEIEGGDTQVIALWRNGNFRAEQSLPNLTGELTGLVEQTGSLAITKAPRLLAWVHEYRLTCDLKIERPGENAHLAFKNGQLESADVNGRPELGALARVQAWTDGFYRIGLRPLFTEGGVIALQPPPAEGNAPAGNSFDVSKSIPLDLKQRARLDTPPPEVVSVGDATTGAIAAAKEAPKPPMARLSSTSPELDSAPPLSTALVPELARSGGSRVAWILFGLAIALGGYAGAAWYLHLPPFNLPAAAKPDEKPVAKVETPPKKNVEKPIEKPVAKKTEEEKPVAKKTEEEKPEVKVDPKKVDPAELDPKGKEGVPTHAEIPSAASLDARLIEKGRLLEIDGHPHSALSLFHKAEQANPKNALVKVLEQQAMGKLGRAEVVIEGRGEINIDGKRFEAGKKLKLLAGPHSVDNGSGPEEVTLKKGERKKLRARP